MTKTKIHAKKQITVLVITQNQLLGGVLEVLLSDEFTLSAYQTGQNPFEQQKLIEFIDRHQPQVVILEHGTISEAYLMNYLVQYGRTRLILINSSGNQIQVHDHFPVLLTEVADFTSLLLIPD